MLIPIDEIRPDPNQPRRYFKKSALEELARSIELVGQLTPIAVRRLPDKVDRHRYEIIDGERRWRACRLAQRANVKATIEEAPLTEQQRHLLSTISNFHREGHTHIEISDAVHFQRQQGISVEVLTENLARSKEWIYQYLSLQRLAPELRDKMHPEMPKETQLRFSEAVVLSSLEPQQQIDAYRKAVKLDFGERLRFLRSRAAAIQGKERLGRPPHVSERRETLEKSIAALCRQIDSALELKDRDFEAMIRTTEPAKLQRFLTRIEKLRADVCVMADAIASAQSRAAKAAA